MIASDYEIQPGRTYEEFEKDQLDEYISAISETKDLLIQLAGGFLAATKYLENNGVSTRLSVDSAYDKLTDTMERLTELASLESYLTNRKDEIRIKAQE